MVYREPTGRPFIVIDIERVVEVEEKEREMSRERDREKERRTRGERHMRGERHKKRATREERERWKARERLPSKRSRVYVQNARVLCDTGVLKVHGCVLNEQTGAFFQCKTRRNAHPHTRERHVKREPDEKREKKGRQSCEERERSTKREIVKREIDGKIER